MGKRLILAGVAIAAMFLLSGCAGPNPLVGTPGSHGVAGFLAGLWHGIICPVTFFVSLFDHRIQIYEVHNNGNWYNFGFVLGGGLLFGGGAAGKRS